MVASFDPSSSRAPTVRNSCFPNQPFIMARTSPYDFHDVFQILGGLDFDLFKMTIFEPGRVLIQFPWMLGMIDRRPSLCEEDADDAEHLHVMFHEVKLSLLRDLVLSWFFVDQLFS